MRNNEKGAIFIEATMVLTIVMIVLAALLGLGFLIYQKSSLNTIACETAEYAANNYKYTDLKQINTDTVPETYTYNLKKFRSFRVLLDKDKILKYAKKRSKLTSFGENSISVKKAELIRDGIGRQRIKLTLEMKVSIVFENIMVAIGLIDDNPTIKKTAYAECLDLTQYSGQVYYAKYLQDYVAGTNVGKIVDGVSGIIDGVLDIFGKILK